MVQRGRRPKQNDCIKHKVFFLAASVCGLRNKLAVKISTDIVFIFLPFWGELGVTILGVGSFFIITHVNFLFFYRNKMNRYFFLNTYSVAGTEPYHSLHMDFSCKPCAYPRWGHP